MTETVQSAVQTGVDLSLILSIIGAITGVSGMVVGILGVVRSRYQTVSEFFSAVEKPEFIRARGAVYAAKEFAVGDENAAYVINFFHHWGLMAKKHYLPMWVFDGASGAGAVRLYERLEPHINRLRDKNGDKRYAEYFEWLCKKIGERHA